MIWWIDAQAGASGDMLLGALLALDPQGLPVAQQAVDTALAQLGGESVTLSVTACTRAGMAAQRAEVTCSDSSTHRTWADIAPVVTGRAHAVFSALAVAEATVHGVPVDQIHFHEVGALDAIADIVAVCTLVDRLAPQRIVVSPVCVGSGTVETQHGVLSVPGPAVTELLRGVPTFGGVVAHEACTPTGAALLRMLADEWGPQPAVTVSGVGVGAGGRDHPQRPNVLRILSGFINDDAGLHVVETTIDDLDPRLYPEVITAVKQAGAVEAWLTPVTMKHGRPGVTVTALAPQVDAVARALFEHTTTLGVRFHRVERRTLERDVVNRTVDGRVVSVKRGWLDGVIVTEQPEYQDVRTAAKALGVPEREILRRLAAQQKGSDATDGGDSDVRTLEI
ncbi:MAG: nickel pincer cofactor biosynthesis protein LarC [Candidatus Nanopelagicales bacterium]